LSSISSYLSHFFRHFNLTLYKFRQENFQIFYASLRYCHTSKAGKFANDKLRLPSVRGLQQRFYTVGERQNFQQGVNKMAGAPGIEPWTSGSKVPRSTNCAKKPISP